jgi:hypothetical protein
MPWGFFIGDAYLYSFRTTIIKEETMSTQSNPAVPTDKQKLVALLTEFGVGFTEDSRVHGSSISCEKGQQKVGGYNGFSTEFQFDVAGNFIQMCCWE